MPPLIPVAMGVAWCAGGLSIHTGEGSIPSTSTSGELAERQSTGLINHGHRASFEATRDARVQIPYSPPQPNSHILPYLGCMSRQIS